MVMVCLTPMNELLGTDPLDPDTDNDGVDDGTEYVNRKDPLTPDAGCSQVGLMGGLWIWLVGLLGMRRKT